MELVQPSQLQLSRCLPPFPEAHTKMDPRPRRPRTTPFRKARFASGPGPSTVLPVWARRGDFFSLFVKEQYVCRNYLFIRFPKYLLLLLQCQISFQTLAFTKNFSLQLLFCLDYQNNCYFLLTSIIFFKIHENITLFFPFLCKTRTGSVQKVCGGVWQGFDHLTKLESSKVEVVLQWGLLNFK